MSANKSRSHRSHHVRARPCWKSFQEDAFAKVMARYVLWLASESMQATEKGSHTTQEDGYANEP